MKSIVEEASSVIKAIEKGWTQAGNPQEFTIKVFEVEKKNFLGMTSKPAKIAIFFKEAAPAPSRPAKRAPQKEMPRKDVKREKRIEKPADKPVAQPQPQKETKKEKKGNVKKERTWTPEMIQHTQQWINNILSMIGKSNIKITIEPKNYYLKLTFAEPIFADQNKERLLFRSFAHLILQTLRNKFKKSFKGFKLILLSPSADTGTN